MAFGKRLPLDHIEEICYAQILGRTLGVLPGNRTEMNGRDSLTKLVQTDVEISQQSVGKIIFF